MTVREAARLLAGLPEEWQDSPIVIDTNMYGAQYPTATRATHLVGVRICRCARWVELSEHPDKCTVLATGEIVARQETNPDARLYPTDSPNPPPSPTYSP